MRSLKVALLTAAAVLLTAAPAWADEEATTAALTPIAQLVQDRGLVGVLGPVTVPERAIPGGRQQDHQNGLVLQQDGAEPLVVGPQASDHAYTSKFGRAYTRAGGATGELGFPLAEVQCTDWRAPGCSQRFEGGSIVRSSVDWETLVVPRVIEDGWVASGRERGSLGWPGMQRETAVGGVKQLFEGGTVYWSPATGSHAVTGRSGFREAHGWEAESGPLGYPTTDETCNLRGGGCVQKFQGGSIYASMDNGVHVVSAAVGAVWARQGSQDGPLGYPTSDEVCGPTPGRCTQTFEGGGIYRNPPGRYTVTGDIYGTWSRIGAEKGRLGYPTATVTCGLRGGGCVQSFQGGLVYSARAAGSHVVLGAIRTAYAAQGWETGRLGYPISSERCGLRGGGCFQEFQGGALYWSPASGAHVVLGAIRVSWVRQGWEAGRLGYPTSNERCGLRGGGCFQLFQGGSIYWSPASGAHVVVGGIRDIWARQGWEAGRLGYPIGSEWFWAGTYMQQFQGGTIGISARGPQITYNL